ncbi:MAG: excinuclease ABC subunit UvrC [Fibromonadaceae bacterium]|jgi:excinuclease ABC subunit C|nr:excinuclease ABC subunit UvrC [Fibromonadaceae bacterium]
MLQSIENRLQSLPAKPGVYLMKNAECEIIYIGKAKSLNKRVRNYFDGREKNAHRIAMFMLPHIADIEWIITESEAEALILEANLINKHLPHYNIRQKDNKHYPYLVLTIAEKFPRLKISRKVQDDKNLYFGPLVNSRHTWLLLELIPKLFKLRDCNTTFPYTKRKRPCLNFHIGRCHAPCVKKIDEEIYQKSVQETRMLLEGRSSDIVAQWEKEMQLAADEMRFEEASKLRDQIQAVQSAFAEQSTDAANVDLSLDVIAICKAKELATVVIIEYRNGILYNRRYFNLENELGMQAPEILTEFLSRWYLSVKKEEMPREIALEISLDEEQEVFEELLARKAGYKVTVAIPQLGKKVGFLQIAKANAEMLLVELQTKKTKYEEINRSIFELQKELKLSSPPFCIECFDISHLSGTNPVASMVRFVNGSPSKKAYRKYIVKRAMGGDDYGGMREVIMRRLTRLQKESEELPDLLVVDGGKGQVEAAFATLRELGLSDIPLIGLAKRQEKIYFPGSKPSVMLKKSNPALQLLQRVRDEAHRFAVKFQRDNRKSGV